MCLESFVLEWRKKKRQIFLRKTLKWNGARERNIMEREREGGRETESKAYEIIIKRHILK